MPFKQFSERLNNELDSIGVPSPHDERVEVFSKLIKLPKFKAQSLLNGLVLPDEKVLNTLADELEVNADWLVGKSDSKHN